MSKIQLTWIWRHLIIWRIRMRNSMIMNMMNLWLMMEVEFFYFIIVWFDDIELIELINNYLIDQWRTISLSLRYLDLEVREAIFLFLDKLKLKDSNQCKESLVWSRLLLKPDLNSRVPSWLWTLLTVIVNLFSWMGWSDAFSCDWS